MDIEFFCSHCGQSLSIDESGAGITVDCPKCNQPVYVPSKQPTPTSTPPDPPTRVVPKQPLGRATNSPASSPRPKAPVVLPGHDLALTAGETVLLQGRMHDVVVALPAIVYLIFGIFAFISASIFNVVVHAILHALTGGQSPAMPSGFGFMFILPGILLLPIAVIFTIVAWLARARTLVTLTNRRLIINQGVLSRTTAELLLRQVETVAVHVPLLGRAFGYGTVVVRGTGGGVFSLPYMQNPRQLFANLQQTIDSSRKAVGPQY